MRMKTSQLLILLATTALLMFGITAIVFNQYKILDIRTVDMKVAITNEIGFAATSGYLNFGTVARGTGSASRFVNVINNGEKPVLLRVVVSGDLKQWTQITPSQQLLQPNSTEMISFAVVAPVDAAYGNYTGTAKFIYERS